MNGPVTHGQEGSRLAALAQRVETLTTVFAATGGAVLLTVAVYAAVSITGRSLGTGSLFGDFEVVKYGSGVAAFLFLPLCQWKREHICVEIFSLVLPKSGQTALDRFWEFVFAIVWIVVAWRLMVGAFDAYEWEELSLIIQFPVWWVYVPAIISLGLVIVAAVVRIVVPQEQADT